MQQQGYDLKGNILVNGVECNSISVIDRGLQYGDGLFETIAVYEGQPILWEQHIERLMHACRRLDIPVPDPSLLLKEALHLAAGNKKAVLKIIYTRGSGGRGYRKPETQQPARILSISPWPDYPGQPDDNGVVLRVCETRLGNNPALAGLKHLNRLEQVLARSEWSDPAIYEGMMLDFHGHLIEGTMTNVFFVRNGVLCTPLLKSCGVAGVMRERVLQQAEKLRLATLIDEFTPADLLQADEVFLTNSLIGIWPVRQILFEKPKRFQVPGLITKKLQVELRHESGNTDQK